MSEPTDTPAAPAAPAPAKPNLPPANWALTIPVGLRDTVLGKIANLPAILRELKVNNPCPERLAIIQEAAQKLVALHGPEKNGFRVHLECRGATGTQFTILVEPHEL